MRAQLCLATALIAAALYPADADVGADCPGPAAVVYGADGPARELPAALQVQILTALPQACPHHHEQLRSSLLGVLTLLQQQVSPAAGASVGCADLQLAQCVRAWQPLVRHALWKGGGSLRQLLGMLAWHAL